MKVLLSQLVQNPYRDLTLFPIDNDKVAKLKESIEQTDFWDNLLARPAGNEVDGMTDKELAEYLNDLECAYDEDGEPLFTVELAYGHHRWAAVSDLEMEEIDIPIKVIDDETMLRIMANENRGDWGAGNMNVILETVRQTKEKIMSIANSYDSFEEYEDAGGTFFDSAKGFGRAKHTVGFDIIQRFLGESWKVNDIRAATETLKSIDDGLYLQSMITAMPSTGMLRNFNTMAKNVFKQSWASFFKNKMIADVCDYILDDNTKATVKTVDLAAKAAKAGRDPLIYLETGKRKDFDPVAVLVDLADPKVISKEDKTMPMSVEDISELIGEFDDKDEMLLKLQEILDKKKAKDTKGDEADAPEVDEKTVVEDDGEEELDLQKAIDDAEANENLEIAKVLEVPEGEAPKPISSISENFIQASGSFSAYCKTIADRFDEIEADDAVTHAAINHAAESAITLVLRAHNRDAVVAMVDRLEKDIVSE